VLVRVFSVLTLAVAVGGLPASRQSLREGTLEGRVEAFTGEQRIPARRVRITLTDTSGGQIASETNVSGAFRVERVPAGQYRVTAQKAGFFPSQVPVVQIADGGTSTTHLILTPAAAFEGRVVHATGQPAPDLIVTAEPVAQPGATIALAETRWERTDDLGRFRVHTLIPGAYRLRVSAPLRTSGRGMFYPGTEDPEQAATITAVSGETAAPLDFVVESPASIPQAPTHPVRRAMEGRILDEFGEPISGVSIQALVRGATGRLFAPTPAALYNGWTDDRGVFRLFNLPPGDYYLLARSGLFGNANTWMSSFKVDAPLGFAPTFYPGASEMSGAGIVSLLAGTDLTGLDFSLVPDGVTTFAGNVVDHGGQPVRNTDITINSLQSLLLTRRTTDASGRFQVKGVPEGSHVVVVRTQELMGSMTTTVPPATGPQFVNVTLGVRPVRRVEGVVRFEGSGPRPDRVDVLMRQSGPDSPGPVTFSVVAAPDADGWFTLRHFIKAGVIRTTASGWILKSVVLEGRDITDVPFNFLDADVSGVEVTLTNRTGSVEGTVIDGDVRRSNASVIFYAADPSQIGPWTRLVATARSGEGGRFVVKDMTPGRYFAVAMTEPAPDAVNVGAGLLDRVRAFAVPINVSEGSNGPLTLKLAKP
jgi:hypothetical protein